MRVMGVFRVICLRDLSFSRRRSSGSGSRSTRLPECVELCNHLRVASDFLAR